MHRFSVAERCAGREPEFEDPATLERIGRFIGRLHAVGRRRRSAPARPGPDAPTAGVPLRCCWRATSCRTTKRPAWGACDARAGRRRRPPSTRRTAGHLRLHGDCHLGNVLWRDARPARGGPRRRHAGPGRAGPVDAGLGRPADDGAAARRAARRLRAVLRLRRPRARTDRTAAHAAHAAPQRLAGRALGRPDLPGNFPFFGTAAYWNQQTTQLREQIEAMGG